MCIKHNVDFFETMATNRLPLQRNPLIIKLLFNNRNHWRSRSEGELTVQLNHVNKEKTGHHPINNNFIRKFPESYIKNWVLTFVDKTNLIYYMHKAQRGFFWNHSHRLPLQRKQEIHRQNPLTIKLLFNNRNDWRSDEELVV